MEAIEIHTNAPIRWKIGRGSPLVLDLDLGPGRIVNPRLNQIGPYPGFFATKNDDCIIISSSSITITLEKTSYAEFKADDPLFLGHLNGFLSWVRCLALLFEIGSSPSVIAIRRIADLPEEMPHMPAVSEVEGNGYAREYFLANHVDEAMARTALQRVKLGTPPPIHKMILVDAFAAFFQNDYRQCLLFAAIAAETFAAGCLEQEYNRRIASGIGPEIRIVDLPQAEGKTKPKDPVYEALASRTDFSTLIHERPLYLLQRSLLVDQPDTYRLALKLYSTRNKLVHRGELRGPNPEQAFAMTRSDCVQALDCVSKIYAWFGEGGIKFPSNRLVPVTFISVPE